MQGSSRTFEERVYAIVRAIPRGKVASYGLVAMLAGKFGRARAVGKIMRDVEPSAKLSCHRVIKSNGSLAHPSIFHGKQAAMLRREGVIIKPNGHVDMVRCEWDGPERNLRLRGLH